MNISMVKLESETPTSCVNITHARTHTHTHTHIHTYTHAHAHTHTHWCSPQIQAWLSWRVQWKHARVSCQKPQSELPGWRRRCGPVIGGVHCMSKFLGSFMGRLYSLFVS